MPDTIPRDDRGRWYDNRMPMPPHAAREGTQIVGDVDAFLDYVESGQAMQDWQALYHDAQQRLADGVWIVAPNIAAPPSERG